MEATYIISNNGTNERETCRSRTGEARSARPGATHPHPSTSIHIIQLAVWRFTTQVTND